VTAAVPLSISAEDVSAFFDEQVPQELEKAGVAGAAIAIVKDGQVLFARGYGYADLQQRKPVSPSATLFRIASVSKVVTYTAVMQLVEQGKIELDSDVSRYLDFPIPATFGAPITMRHLMTHTAGFEDTLEGRWVQPGKLGPLRDYLVRQMPRRIFAPGAVPAYSSYSTTLAGYIVERVAGEPFERYVEHHVFAPLGMQHSSFAQPLPTRLAPLLAKGYDAAPGPARPFDTAQITPGTGMSSTALDMARLMLAHLDGAATSVLTPAALAQMHSVQYRHHPAGPGVALGMVEMDMAGPRLLGHNGDIPGFHSGMYLWPEARLGLFIVQNTAGSGLRDTLLKRFAARYLATPPGAVLTQVAGRAGGSEQLQGSYRTSEHFETSPLALKSLAMDQSVVRMLAPDKLTIDNRLGPDGKPVEWRRVGDGIWQSAANPLRRIYFSKSAHGDWTMSNNADPHRILQRVPWYQHKHIIQFVLLMSLATTLISVLAWSVSAVMRRRGAKRILPTPMVTAHKAIRWAALLTLAPWLLYLSLALVIMHDNLFVSAPACALLLRLDQALAWGAVAGAATAMWAALVSLRTQQVSWPNRLHYLLLALAGAGGVTMAYLGGLLIWNGQY